MKHLFLLCPLLFSSCATYDEQFECTPGKGVGCKSLTQVNHMVEIGELPLREVEKPAEVPPTSQKSLRVWVAEHEEEDGLVHEEHYVSLQPETGARQS